MSSLWLILALVLAGLAFIFALDDQGIPAAACAVALFLVALGAPHYDE
jgi:hypothetical protein